MGQIESFNTLFLVSTKWTPHSPGLWHRHNCADILRWLHLCCLSSLFVISKQELPLPSLPVSPLSPRSSLFSSSAKELVAKQGRVSTTPKSGKCLLCHVLGINPHPPHQVVHHQHQQQRRGRRPETSWRLSRWRGDRAVASSWPAQVVAIGV